MRNLTMLLALAGLLASARAAGAQSPKTVHDAATGTLLSISTDSPEVKAGSAVLLKVVVTNRNENQILVFREKKGRDTQLDVRDGKGSLAPETEFGYPRNGHADMSRVPATFLAVSGASLPVEPGKTLTYGLNVSERYDLSSPGKYTIQVQRFDEDGKTILKSNTITVTVVAK